MRNQLRHSVPENEHGNVITVHDLPQTDRENIEIVRSAGHAQQWRWKAGHAPHS